METGYDASKGIAGLSEQNFANSPYSALGLTLAFVRSLAAKGYSAQSILHAGETAKKLGFDPNDPNWEKVVKSLAHLNEKHPAGREARDAALERYRQWVEENREELDARRRAIAGESDPIRRKAQQDQLDKMLKGGEDSSGVTAVRKQPELKDEGEHLDNLTRGIRDGNKASREHRLRSGADAMRDMNDQAAIKPASAVGAAARKQCEQTLKAEDETANAASLFGKAPTDDASRITPANKLPKPPV